jgi:hypothetical protein
VNRYYTQTSSRGGANRRRKLVLWLPLKRAVTHCKQGIGAEPLFMLRCDQNPVMPAWLQQLTSGLLVIQDLVNVDDS